MLFCSLPEIFHINEFKFILRIIWLLVIDLGGTSDTMRTRRPDGLVCCFSFSIDTFTQLFASGILEIVLHVQTILLYTSNTNGSENITFCNKRFIRSGYARHNWSHHGTNIQIKNEKLGDYSSLPFYQFSRLLFLQIHVVMITYFRNSTFKISVWQRKGCSKDRIHFLLALKIEFHCRQQ